MANVTGLRRRLGIVTIVAMAAAAATAGRAATPIMVDTPAVGERAPAFSLAALDGSQVALADALRHGPVVLVLGRGWPGYQCPFCTKQFGELRAHANEIERAGASVLWVYPGPAEDLAMHARDFVAGKDLPASIRILADPGFVFTSAYGLRWDAPGETAYPATFVVDQTGIVRFAQVSRVHGGRTPVADVLTALSALSKPSR